MTKIIAAIDCSIYANNVCQASAWASKETGQEIAILHVIEPSLTYKNNDNLSGAIGLGAKVDLLKELGEIDEAQGKIEMKKGQIIIDHATAKFKELGIKKVDILHRRDSLDGAIKDLGDEVTIIVMGKYGEHSNSDANHLGSNVERVIRSSKKPVLIAADKVPIIKNFLLAYDGNEGSKKALDFIINSPLLKQSHCHLLNVGENNSKNQEIINQAKIKLQDSSFKVTDQIIDSKSANKTILEYVNNNQKDLLAMGAYKNSQLFNLILGSTTATIIHKAEIPLLVFG